MKYLYIPLRSYKTTLKLYQVSAPSNFISHYVHIKPGNTSPGWPPTTNFISHYVHIKPEEKPKSEEEQMFFISHYVHIKPNHAA